MSQSLQQSLDTFFNFLPNLMAFLVILLIGYIVAKLVKTVVAKALQKAGLDKHVLDYTRTAAELVAFGVPQRPAAAEPLNILEAAREAANYVPTDGLLTEYSAGKITPKNVAQRVRDIAAAVTAQANVRPVTMQLESAPLRTIRDAVRDDAEGVIGHCDRPSTRLPRSSRGQSSTLDPMRRRTRFSS